MGVIVEMASPTGIIPDELMRFEKRKEVIAFLMGLAVPGEVKLSLFQGWCSWTGTRTSKRERTMLQNSGVDSGE